MEMSTPDLDAAFAVTESNGFAPDLRDYNGRRVVVVASRPVTGAPWVLMYTVDYEEALGAADTRFRTLAAMLALALLVIAIAIIAVWRHGSSRRASEAATRAQILAQQLRGAEGSAAAGHRQPADQHLHPRQPRTATASPTRRPAPSAGITPAEMLSKEIAAVLGPASAKRYLEPQRAGAEDRRPPSTRWRGWRTTQGLKVLQSEHIPLKERSAAGDRRRADGRARHHRRGDRAREARAHPAEPGQDPGQRGRPARSLRRQPFDPGRAGGAARSRARWA